jgi:hypothetical protein
VADASQTDELEPAKAPEPLSYITAFQSTRQYLIELHGDDGWQRVRDAMYERHYIPLPPEFETGTWLPTLWFTTALNVARDLFGPPDFHERFGAAAAEYEVSWMHRVALRFTSPLWLLERGAAYWRRAHTTGTWEVEGHKGWVRGTLRGFGVVDAGYCDSLRTWLLRACLMTGASKTFIAERTCRARGPGKSDVCIFEGTW